MQNQTSQYGTQMHNGAHGDTFGHHSHQDNVKHFNENLDSSNPPRQLPASTFERTSFDQLMRQYDHKHDLPPTLELTQAFLMTQNMKETAARVNSLTAGGATYFMKNDYVGDTMRFSDAMQSVSRLLGNLGPSDKASNFLLEQRNLMRAQSRENKEIRDLIEEKIVDGLEYVRVKEKIAETKSRVKDLIDVQFSSDDQISENHQLLNGERGLKGGIHQNHNKEGGSDTQEDSEEALKNRQLQERKIRSIIKKIREEGRRYLNLSEVENPNRLGLHQIYSKLKTNKRYQRKREEKAQQKGKVDMLKEAQEQLKFELQKVEEEAKGIKRDKKELERMVKQYSAAQGSEKRQRTQDTFEKSISEIDTLPINSRSYELQNILFNFCDINLKGEPIRHKKSKVNLFGKMKKLPSKSTLLQSYQEGEGKGATAANENTLTAQARKKNVELVKVIGLDPEKMYQNLSKYKIQIQKMPKFSNIFERAEPIISGLGMTVPGSLISGNQQGQMCFTRVDGRNVISLQFNPYEISNDTYKRKVYDQAMKDLVEQREKIKSISKQAREKQESANIKRAWLNIVKKEIPKAYRTYQKYKQDLENNNKKQSQNCLKEVRKKALKTQRLVKETAMRAKKLNREMMNFWKKRDKEIADLKKKKERLELLQRKRIEEEKEAELQKKRLEYIMKQSEIYAFFMSKNLGLLEEQNKQKNQDLEDERKENVRRAEVDIDQAKGLVVQMINQNRERVNLFDTEQKNSATKKLMNVNEDELEVDKFDNPDENISNIIQAPTCFKGELKHYQLKGLRWLDNLYEQGINGILADEMGLGKTIQAISLLAHLYESKGVWGPFLIVVPVTTLHNWQNELSKFCPALKVLPYFGSPEERKRLGRFLDPKNLYNPNVQINVLLTSYNLLVNNPKDQQKLIRVKWHYMILDEAQAIKNNLSRRWKILLQFNARNRLLLTGTPIQNSMAELWALLHFIMPKLFDSHEQFQEWFSKDIEQHSMNQGEISKHQLKRLHLVLKPFMLRRLKKDVEQEIGHKVEYERYCEMTHRQRVLYQRIKNKISTKDLFQLVDSKLKMENLMNLVMQFRKVCNHPELFERRVGRIPFSFRGLQHGMWQNQALQSKPEIIISMKNPICYKIPKLVFDECFIYSDNNTKQFRKLRKNLDISLCEVSHETNQKFFNIFNTLNLHQECFTSGSGFGILRFLASSNKWSLGELAYLFVADPLMKQISLLHYYSQKYQKRMYTNFHNNPSDYIECSFNEIGSNKFYHAPNLDLNVVDFVKFDKCSFIYRKQTIIDEMTGHQEQLIPLITNDHNLYTKFSRDFQMELDIYVYKSQAEPIEVTCRSGSFPRFVASVFYSSMHKKILLGKDFKPKNEIHIGRVGRDRSSFLTEDTGTSWKNSPPVGYSLIENGIIGDIIIEKGASLLELPNYSRLVTDCAKMQFLDKLLKDLHKDRHRCLIFCQMTRMLDILEDYISWRKYTYFRMDGSTSIQDRRYMVEEFQKNPDIFAFLLSTRAGGLGVNLTGADTVIFYDNDWNPTMDAQATDRAHRIGQTKKVSVYRIITKGTVEEKIVKRAKQKQTVQSTVYGGNALKADVFKPKDVVDMLLDDEETNALKDRGQKFLKTKRMKKFFKSDSHHHHGHDEREDRGPESPLQRQSSNNQQIAAQKKEKQQKKEVQVKTKVAKKVEKPPKPATNIFSTVRSDSQPKTQAQGPFNVFSVTKAAAAASAGEKMQGDQEMKKVDEDEGEYGEEGEEEEDEEYEDKETARLLEILESSDEGEGVVIQFEEEEGGQKQDSNVKSKDKKRDIDEDEDMAEEY